MLDVCAIFKIKLKSYPVVPKMMFGKVGDGRQPWAGYGYPPILNFSFSLWLSFAKIMTILMVCSVHLCIACVCYMLMGNFVLAHHKI